MYNYVGLYFYIFKIVSKEKDSNTYQQAYQPKYRILLTIDLTIFQWIRVNILNIKNPSI